jgi:hypothetical protein
VAHIHSLTACVKDEFRIFLVDCVVRQVDVLLFEVALVGFDIGLGCKTGKTLLIDIEP